MSRQTHVQRNNFDKQQMANRMNNKPTKADEYDMNFDRVNNKSVNSDLYQAVFPIYHLSKLCGVFPMRFVRKVSGSYQSRFSVTDSIYSMCLLTCLLGTEVWGFWRDFKDGLEYSTRLKSQIALIVTTTDVVGVMSLTASSIIGSILCWKHVQTIIDKLVDQYYVLYGLLLRSIFTFIILSPFALKCDEKLGNVSSKKIRRYTIFLTLCSLLYIIVLSCLDIHIWNYEENMEHMKLNKKLNDKGPINYVPLYFMYIVIMMIEIQYAVATYNVSQRFCRLNNNLENTLKSSRITDQFRKDFGLGDLRDQGQITTYIQQHIGNVRMFRRSKVMDSSIINDGKSFTDNISQLMAVHASLCDTVMLINAAYGVVALVITITCLIHLIITPYFVIMDASRRGEPLRLAIQGLWGIFHIWTLLMIVQPTYATKTEAKKTAVLVSQLLSMSPNKEARKQLEIFSLQLIHRPLEFSACGLFNLDRSLVTSIAGTVATYLVILIQFQKEDDTKGNFDNMLKNATQMLLKNASTLHNIMAGKLGSN